MLTALPAPDAGGFAHLAWGPAEAEFARGVALYEGDLLPEWETEEEALQHLAELSNEIFEEQLNGWYRVPAVWPSQRDLMPSAVGSSVVFIPSSLIFPTC